MYKVLQYTSHFFICEVGYLLALQTTAVLMSSQCLDSAIFSLNFALYPNVNASIYMTQVFQVVTEGVWMSRIA